MGNRNQTFNASSTAEQVSEGVDLSGKVIIVTGCNTGIGKETVRVLALRGATIIMACRDTEKAEKAKEDIVKSLSNVSTEEKKDTANEEKKEATNANSNVGERLQVMRLDLGSLQSVRDFVRVFVEKYNELHYLVNNAGIMALPEYGLTTDGYEMQFGTNHLGHYYLIRLLIPTMKNTTGMTRVVQLSSAAHNRAPNPMSAVVDDFVKRQDGPAKDTYGPWSIYGVSKACNILCARHLNTLYSKEENGIYGVSVHPGVIPTELGRHMASAIQWTFKKFEGWILKTIPQGAATTVRCVCLKNEELNGGGRYYQDCNEREDKLRADLRLQTESKEQSMDAKLWELSEKLIIAKGFSMTLEEESKEAKTTEVQQSNDTQQVQNNDTQQGQGDDSQPGQDDDDMQERMNNETE